MTYVILTAGIDLSVGSILALTGVVTASLLQGETMPVPAAVLLGLGLGALLGMVNGAIITQLNVPPFVTTLGMMTIARGLALTFTEGRPITGLPDSFRVLGTGSLGPIPVPILIATTAFIVGYVVLNHTTIGEYVFALGNNPVAARYAGINTGTYTIFVYMVAGVLAALAGLILTARLNSAQPTAGLAYEFDAIAAVVKFRAVLSLLLIAILLTMAACGGSEAPAEPAAPAESDTASEAPAAEQAEEAEAPAADAGLTLGLSLSTLNNPFFVTLKEGAEAAAAEAGAELIVVDAQDDPAKEATNIEDLIQKGVDALLINPTDADAIVPSIQKANQAGIPVFTIDRGASGGEITSHIASDNVAGGAMAAEFLCDAIGGSGQVVELEGIAGTSAARDRGQGFNDYMSANCAGAEIVAKQTANFIPVSV